MEKSPVSILATDEIGFCVQLTLSPCDFVEAEQDTLLMQGLADQITSLGRNMVIVLAKDLYVVLAVVQTKVKSDRFKKTRSDIPSASRP
jgi:hypothetical protein